MAQFKVGGKVVCIKGAEWQSDLGYGKYKNVKGEIYTVLAVKTCKCGRLTLDIGIRYPKMNIPAVSECKCGAQIFTHIIYCDARRFVPIDETEFRQVTFEKIINEIPVSAQ